MSRVESEDDESEVITLSSDDEEISKCIICYEEETSDEKLVPLYCTHKFHNDCANNWLRLDGSCPVCRMVFSNIRQFLDDQDAAVFFFLKIM